MPLAGSGRVCDDPNGEKLQCIFFLRACMYFVVCSEPDIIKSVLPQCSVESKAIWMSLGPELICALYSLVI